MTNRNFLLAIVLALVLSLTVIVACGDDDDDDDDGENDDDSTDDDTVNPDDDDDSTDDDDDDHMPDIEWAFIPKFTFNMGCQEGDDLCNADELPLHTVTVDAFDMATTETTQAQFQAVMGYNPSHFHTGYHEGDSEDKSNHPVETVTWQEAADFCEATGGRLPTEAEWESAARCGSQTIFVCGDDPACVEEYGRIWDNTPP